MMWPFNKLFGRAKPQAATPEPEARSIAAEVYKQIQRNDAEARARACGRTLQPRMPVAASNQPRVEHVRQRESATAARYQDDANEATGFVMGLTTGIPIPLTPMAVVGAAIHNSMTASCEASPSGSSDSYSGSPSDSSSSSSSDW
jgi:hypothetical protein